MSQRVAGPGVFQSEVPEAYSGRGQRLRPPGWWVVDIGISGDGEAPRRLLSAGHRRELIRAAARRQNHLIRLWFHRCHPYGGAQDHLVKGLQASSVRAEEAQIDVYRDLSAGVTGRSEVEPGVVNKPGQRGGAASASGATRRACSFHGEVSVVADRALNHRLGSQPAVTKRRGQLWPAWGGCTGMPVGTGMDPDAEPERHAENPSRRHELETPSPRRRRLQRAPSRGHSRPHRRPVCFVCRPGQRQSVTGRP
jgi:hypothetical protein